MKPYSTKMKTSKSIGKRTHTLKELAQRNFAITPNKPNENQAPKFNLVNIQEGLLEVVTNQSVENPEGSTNTLDTSSKYNRNYLESLSLPIDLVNHLIAKEVSKAAKALDLEEAELQAWIDLQVMTPKQTLLTLLRIAEQYRLDPLKEEVALTLYDDISWQAYITVEGYAKILNNLPTFDGITFTQSDESSNGIPLWMECTIYRKDRTHPIVVREYFDEVKREQIIWQKMPRRMLRHRVLQQCARLAIG